jgi:hypothetical protein
MRWLSLLITSIGIVLSGPAFALPQPDAEAAYARGDYATAFKIWLPLAEQGSPEAQRNIARMYERGEWVAQDRQAAAEWYSKAAEQSARDAGTPGAPVVASAVPVTTPTTYPRPPSYPGSSYPGSPYPASPAPVFVPITRPIFVPVFRFHRHHH